MARGKRAGGAATVLLIAALFPAASGPMPASTTVIGEATVRVSEAPASAASGSSAAPGHSARRMINLVSGTAPPALPARSALVEVLLAQPEIDCSVVKCVALTFDDGPGPDTERLLGILAERGARATFFVLGRLARENPDMIRRMSASGHELGNHTWSHPSLPGLPAAQVRAELERTQSIVRTLTGRDMNLMRPPYGSTGAKVAREAAGLGLAQILWSADTFDWRDRSAELVAKRAGKAKPGDIVLMHDIHPTTVDAVPKVMDKLEKRGLQPATITELYGSRRLVPGLEYHGRPPPVPK